VPSRRKCHARKYIEGLGGLQTLIEIDTCHMVPVSEPERLAQILIEPLSAVREVT
jgi:hypothetical protein